MGCPVTHFQVLARDPGKLAAFYGELFDWTIDDSNPLGYRQAETGTSTGIGGGFWPCPPDGQAMVQLYVQVDDIATHIDRAVALGASVVMPPQTLPGGDEMAILTDPEGLPLGLMKPAPKADKN